MTISSIASMFGQYPPIVWRGFPACSFQDQLFRKHGQIVIYNSGYNPDAPAPWNWFHVLRARRRSCMVMCRPNFENQLWYIDFVFWRASGYGEKHDIYERVGREAEGATKSEGYRVSQRKIQIRPIEEKRDDPELETIKIVMDIVNKVNHKIDSPSCKKMGSTDFGYHKNIISINAQNLHVVASTMVTLLSERYAMFYPSYLHDTLYQLLSGRQPFASPSVSEIRIIMSMILNGNYNRSESDLLKIFKDAGYRVNLEEIRRVFKIESSTGGGRQKGFPTDLSMDIDTLAKRFKKVGVSIDPSSLRVLLGADPRPNLGPEEIHERFRRAGANVNLNLIRQIYAGYRPPVQQRWAASPPPGAKITRTDLDKALWAVGLPMGLNVNQLPAIDLDKILKLHETRLNLDQYKYKKRSGKEKIIDREGEREERAKFKNMPVFEVDQMKLAKKRLSEIRNAVDLLSMVRLGRVEVSLDGFSHFSAWR